ncbi:MAG TPA: hypothetical protein VK892_16740 [Pyrinomonadaceae bacterium]|nr:hypothetical protein [Pyrinomonadaceae bacterium]
MTVKLSEEKDIRTLESALLEAQELAEQEYFRLQVLGRELNEEEKRRSEVLETCLGYIRDALAALKQS